jgi:hypothetical protein
VTEEEVTAAKQKNDLKEVMVLADALCINTLHDVLKSFKYRYVTSLVVYIPACATATVRSSGVVSTMHVAALTDDSCSTSACAYLSIYLHHAIAVYMSCSVLVSTIYY